MPRMAHVLTSLRSVRASVTAPGRDSACRSAIASSAAEATCACTPASRRATSTGSPPFTGSRNCRRNRQPSTCPHVTFSTNGTLEGRTDTARASQPSGAPSTVSQTGISIRARGRPFLSTVVMVAYTMSPM